MPPTSSSSVSALRSAAQPEAVVRPDFPGAPTRWLDIGHSRLAYYRLGSGPDLVFVHGWPLHSATFRAIAPLLAPHFTCHLIDLPGAGRTRITPQSPIDLRSHAVSLRTAIDQLGLTRYALLAHDSGGGVARLLAADDPRVSAMVLAATEIPGHHPFLISVLRTLLKLPLGVRLIRMSADSAFLRRSPLVFGSCFQDPKNIEGDFKQLFIDPMLASPEVSAAQFALVHNLDDSVIDGLREAHAKIKAPVLLLWGDADPIFPLEKARAMLGQFGGPSSLVVLEGGRTFVHEERPDAVVAHALPFLLAAVTHDPRAKLQRDA